jgi:hypothetical protein
VYSNPPNGARGVIGALAANLTIVLTLEVRKRLALVSQVR